MFERRLGKSAREPGNSDGRDDCPDIWRLDNGDIAVIGRDLTAAYRSRLPDDGLGSALLYGDPQAARRHWAKALRLPAEFDDPRATATRDSLERRLAEAGRVGREVRHAGRDRV